jgi:NhaA family Na+:H+ antiporter
MLEKPENSLSIDTVSVPSSSVHTALWEQKFDRILTPLEAFIHRQTTSSILLMVCAVIALILANAPIGEDYLDLLHTPLGVRVGESYLSMSLLHWISDALMALFFLLVGLELKRELLVGELSDLRRAALPIIAAVGGMLMPASIFWLWNPTGAGAAGWGIPMATDIAFSIGVLSLLGKRIPSSLALFLIALAIVDDLGAVLVIAFFYTQQLNMLGLLAVAVFTALLIALNLGGIRAVVPYLFVGALLWCAMLASGIHATLAGVILAFTIPMRPKYNPDHFVEKAQGLLLQMKDSLHTKPDIIRNDSLRSQVAALENITERVQAPAQRLESELHLMVAYLVIPLFALANAAIPVDLASISVALSNPVTLGVICGLLFGKWLGIVGASWLAVRLKIATLPVGLNLTHLTGVGLLGGIGFTMSIFVADLAYASQPDLLLMAKTGVLLASLMAGVGGYCWLFFTSNTEPTSK